MREKVGKIVKNLAEAIESFNEETGVNFLHTFNDDIVNSRCLCSIQFLIADVSL